MLVARIRFVRSDARQRLDEPATDSIVAIVELASFAIPFFPGKGSTVVNHVEVARIGTLLQHLVHIVGFLVLGGPLGKDVYTHQTGGDMALETTGRYYRTKKP